jgi:hypothetical protein
MHAAHGVEQWTEISHAAVVARRMSRERFNVDAWRTLIVLIETDWLERRARLDCFGGADSWDFLDLWDRADTTSTKQFINSSPAPLNADPTNPIASTRSKISNNQ